jgi:hypothetical protein
MTTGDAGACPAGDYSFGPELYYTDPSQVDDTRGCSACTCGAATGGCSFVGTMNRYGSTCPNLIPTGLPSLMLPQACTTFTSNSGGLASFAAVLAAPNPGTCDPDGGQPVGGATPTVPPTRVCCNTPADAGTP